MGVLDITKKSKQNINATFLKTKNFEKGNWGAPNVSVEGGDPGKRGRYLSERVKTTWPKERKIWEATIPAGEMGENLWFVWFPKGFNGYVTPFHGTPPPYTLMVVPQVSDGTEIFRDVRTQMELDIIIDKMCKKYS